MTIITHNAPREGGQASLRDDISYKYAKWLLSLLPPIPQTGFVYDFALLFHSKMGLFKRNSHI